MISIALYNPEIPPNTGNVARLCAANAVPLHIVGRPMFRFDDRALRRAGLDYWKSVDSHFHKGLEELQVYLGSARLLYFTARPEFTPCFDFTFRPDDCLVFGPESCGFTLEFLQAHRENALSIPMRSGQVRSLNLATAVAVGVYTAMRQLSMF